MSVDKVILTARRHAKAGEIEQAANLYRSVLQKFPKNKRAMQGLQALTQPAAGGWKRGLSPKPDQLKTLLDLYNQGNMQEVIEVADQLRQQFSKSIELYNILGAAFSGLALPDKAAACYKQALEINPYYADAHNNLGAALKELGQLEDAISCYAKAIEVRPDFAQAHNNMGVALHDLGRFEEALASSGEALRLEPDFAEAHYNIGNVYNSLDRPSEAISSYKYALKIRPNYAEAFYNLGITFKDEGRPDDAITNYTAALKVDPTYALAHFNLGHVQNDLGRHEAAADSLTRAVKIKPDYVEAHNNLGTVFHALGRNEEAISSFSQALQISPDNEDTHNNLGFVFAQLGRYEDAYTSFNKALQLNPNLAEAYSNLGDVLRYMGRSKESVESFSAAIALEPDALQHWQSLAVTLSSMGFDSYDPHYAKLCLDIIEQKTLVHYSVIVDPIIRLLSFHPAVEPCLRRSSHESVLQNAFEVAGSLSQEPLVLKVLELCTLPDLDFEHFLKDMRKNLLLGLADVAGNQNILKFQTSLALQCWINEYVYGESDEECAALNALEAQVNATFERGGFVDDNVLACLASYRSLHLYAWSRNLGDRPAISSLVKAQVNDRDDEAAHGSEMPALSKIQDTVSRSVREQYEQNPYPRWIYTNLAQASDRTLTLLSFARNLGLKVQESDTLLSVTPEILVAGCGTGQQAVGTATRLPDSQVLALDLSRNSLSYAKRKTDEIDVQNIEYLQADILDAEMLGRQFDVVESVGVLHHMHDPLAGWRKLERCLKPGGLMKIGLYSELARASVMRLRNRISELGLSSQRDDVLKFRTGLIEADDAELDILRTWADFYSTSELRDLLFHVQEHRFTLPQIQENLAHLELKFVGFEFSGGDKKRQFKDIYPEPEAMYDLGKWHDFEIAHTGFFRGMYQFWVQKPF